MATINHNWETERFKLFISHVSDHRADVEALKYALSLEGICGFVAHSDIEPTHEWQTVIESALFSADALLAYLTPDFIASKWTDQEVGVAYGRGIPIVPVKLNQDPYGLIGKFQALQGAGRAFKDIAKEVRKVLLKNEKTKLAMTSAVVSLFENSSSFANAKENMDRLESITFLDQDLLIRIENAGKNNYQINSAFGVPARVDALIKRFIG